MGVGTLVPFMKFITQPEDEFEIDLDTKIMTHPTVGPLFGSFKFQADIFTCPVRLYNAMLHNNALNIGLDMSKVKLPIAIVDYSYSAKNQGGDGLYKSGKGSIGEYLGVKGQAKDKDEKGQEFQIVPFLAYYDIFKNYYANKQETYFQIMGGSQIVNQATITVEEITFNSVRFVNESENRKKYYAGKSKTKLKFSIESADKEYFPDKLQIKVGDVNGFITSITKEQFAKTVSGDLRTYEYKYDAGSSFLFNLSMENYIGEPATISKTIQKISEGQLVESYTSTYELTQIDSLREYILSLGRKQLVIDGESEQTLKNLFIWKVFRGVS